MLSFFKNFTTSHNRQVRLDDSSVDHFAGTMVSMDKHTCTLLSIHDVGQQTKKMRLSRKRLQMALSRAAQTTNMRTSTILNRLCIYSTRLLKIRPCLGPDRVRMNPTASALVSLGFHVHALFACRWLQAEVGAIHFLLMKYLLTVNCCLVSTST